MLAPSKNLVASALALVAAASVVNGHGYMSDPAVTFISTAGDPTQFIATIESTASGFSGTFNSDPATNTASFTKAFASSKYTSLKEMVTDLGQLISTTGVTITCGLTDPDETAQPLPETYVEWAHSSSEGFTASHEGPCEIWCDDTRVFQDDDCAADYTTAPAQLPYDRDACLGSSQLTFYWLALHSSTWQVYINCAALESTTSTGATSKYAVGSSSTTTSSGSSNSTSTATTAPATTTSAPAATTSAPAVTTSAPTTDVSADGSDDSDCGSLDIAGDYDDESDCGSLDLAGSDDSDCGSLDLAGSDDSDCGSLDLAGSDDGDIGNEADDASFSLDDSTPEPTTSTSTSTSTSGNKGSSTSTSTTTTTTTTTNNSGTSNTSSGTSNTSTGTSTSTGTNTASDEVAGDADTATVDDDSDCGSLDLAGSDDDSDCGSLDLAGSDDDSDCGSLDLAGSDDSDCGSLDLAGSDDENYTGSTTGIDFNTVPLDGSSAGTVEPEA